MLRIYNTLSRQKEEFKSIEDGKVGIYACGVTPYKPSHLGHAMQAVIFDVVRRYFEYLDYDVTYVRNYTDIDDKIINTAKELGVDPLEHSQNMIQQSDEDFDALRIRRADFEPKVSENIDGIIKMTESLIEKGFAYATNKGNVYFRVQQFKDYGKLSNQKLDQLLSGTRKDVEDDKEYAHDFALWKADDDPKQSWESPWGKGRPGWHIECSVMSERHLGEHFDIHGGGGDLTFPHHENEIAQSEAAHDGHFANFWMHNGLLMVGDEKMSKSLGNDKSVREWLEIYHPEVIRYMIISNHYRSNVQFVAERYQEANKVVYRIYKTIQNAKDFIGINSEIDPDLYQRLEREFRENMDDDFNTVKVVAMIHEIVKDINSDIDSGKSDKAGVATRLSFLEVIGNVLGLFDLTPEDFMTDFKKVELGKLGLTIDEIHEMIKERVSARNNKDYAKADEIRDALLEKGIVLMDKEGKTEWQFNI